MNAIKVYLVLLAELCLTTGTFAASPGPVYLTMECRITVMCSGSGTNLQALIDAVAAGKIPGGRIVRVVTNRKDAFATKRAEQAGIPTLYFNMIKEGYHKAGEKNPDILREARSRYDAALAAKILEDKPDLIVLAGWMHVFTESFLEVLEPAGIKIINLHPALPGNHFLRAFPGHPACAVLSGSADR